MSAETDLAFAEMVGQQMSEAMDAWQEPGQQDLRSLRKAMQLGNEYGRLLSDALETDVPSDGRLKAIAQARLTAAMVARIYYREEIHAWEGVLAALETETDPESILSQLSDADSWPD